MALLALLASRTPNREAGQERPHQHERDLALWTAVLSIATVALVGATAYNALILASTDEKINEQAHISAGQLNVMLREERPWIYAEIAPNGTGYPRGDGGVGIPLLFTFHNTGKLPAFFVSPEVDSFLSNDMEDPANSRVRQRQIDLCDRERNGLTSSQKGRGATVFPGQIVQLETDLVYSQAQIEEINAKDGPRTHIPFVFGCIRYTSHDGKSHQTGFAFYVGFTFTDKGGTFVGLPRDLLIRKTDKLFFRPWHSGGTAYAD